MRLFVTALAIVALMGGPLPQSTVSVFWPMETNQRQLNVYDAEDRPLPEDVIQGFQERYYSAIRFTLTGRAVGEEACRRMVKEICFRMGTEIVGADVFESQPHCRGECRDERIVHIEPKALKRR